MGILLRLLSFQRKYWLATLGAYFSLLAATAFSLLVPRLVGQAVDSVLSQGEPRLLLLLALAILLASALRGGFAYAQAYLVEYISQKVAYDLRNALYDRIQHLSFSFHDRAQTGQLMSRATSDVEGVRWFVGFGLQRTVNLVVLLGAVSFLLLSLNWRLALVSFAILPFVAVRAAVVARRLRPIWLAIQQTTAEVGVVLQESLSGVRVVKAFGQEAAQSAKFEVKNRKVYDLNLAANRIQAFNTPFMSFLLALATALVLWYGGRDVVGGNLTPGQLTQFFLYLVMLSMPVRMLGFIVNLFSRATSAGQRVFEILDAMPEVRDRPGARPLGTVRGLVRFEEVSFSYEKRAPVLADVSFEARPGEVVALVGATGSGKTTIVSLLPRFYDVSAGRITIDGTDLREATLASVRGAVGVVQQDVFLFSATIRDNIAYGVPGAGLEEIKAAAKVARLHDFIESLPQGYDTWVGERGITLSGGQKQRLAIARTLLADPRILILDDVTSSVDTETEYYLHLALEELMRGRTTFIVAQRLRTVKRADQILVLHQGRIVERGRHEALLAQGGRYREIYDLQLRDQEEALGPTEAGVGRDAHEFHAPS
ncbi:MAG: ABC transporter ATP-binding protein [Chloroflexi bacterium]|nr:ABC transporter ATP-binding protein [Chloroflexota bacterium]